MKFKKEFMSRSFAWKITPLLLAVFLYAIANLCFQVNSTYSENLGNAFSFIGFYSGLSFLVLSFLPVRVIQLWIFPQILWIIGWALLVRGEIGSSDSIFALSFFYFIFTSIAAVIYGCYLRKKNKEKVWPILVPYGIVLMLLIVLFILVSSATFMNVG